MHRSKSIITALVLLLLSLGITSAWAVTPEFSAEFRARTEADMHRGFQDKSTEDTVNVRSFLRTRIELKLTKDSTTHLFVQIQDSRVYGQPAGVSGGLTNDMNLGIHQAYVDLRQWIWYRLESRIGRQVLNWGNQRLIGGVGWHNVGRSFDGGRLALAFSKARLEAALFTLVERDNLVPPVQGKGQDNLMGYLALRFPSANVDVMWIVDADLTRPATSARTLQRSTLALYSARTFAGQFDYITNLAVQGGTAWDTLSTSELNIEAYLLALELGYTIPGKANARLSLGVDYASGNKYDDTTKFKEFNNMYYTSHKFRGLIDNFLGPFGLRASTGQGLSDLYARGHFDFHPKWRLGIDVHSFQTAADYVSAVDLSDTKKLGWEIDTWVRLKELRGVTWQYGMSLFLWDENTVGTTAETTQFWAYTQIQVNVK